MVTKAETDFATVATYLAAIGKQMTDGIGAVETEVNTLQTGLAALTLTVKGLVASVAALSSGTMITGTGPSLPPGVTANSLPVVNVAPGTTYPTISAALLAVANAGTINVSPGTYDETFHIDGSIFPGGLTIQAVAGKAKQTIINDDGLRLAWQNGIAHMTAPVHFINLAFTGATNGSQTSTGQAAVYCVHPVGTTVTVENCAFFANQANAIQGAAGSGDLVVMNCEFGRDPTGAASPNGLPDGKSHDIYAQGASIVERDCRHYDCDLGHGLKVRCPIYTIDGNYYAHGGGRCLDMPDGGALMSVTNCIFTDLSDAATNVIAYADESTANGTGGIIFTGCTFAISRFASVIWNNSATATLTADPSCVFSSFQQPGVAAATLVLAGVNQVTPAAAGQFVGFPSALPAPTSAYPVPASTI